VKGAALSRPETGSRPDGTRSRLFLRNEKAQCSQDFLRAAGRHRSSVARVGERSALAEGLIRRVNRKLFAAIDRQSFVWIGTEPQAGETVAVENIHGFLRTLLNDRNVQIKRQ
jgi:hypothetical protein